MKDGKYNLLLFMCDQLIPMMTSPYGDPIAKTPNMDRLARDGVRFNNAYTSCPICLPARMSLLTGQYASRIGCNDNGAELSAEEPTHNHYLTLAGYEPVLSGKMHAVGPDQLHGFARRLNTDIYPADFNFLTRRKVKERFSSVHVNPIAIDYTAKGCGVRQWSMQLDFDEETVQKALEFIRTRRTEASGSLQKPLPKRNDTPFFLQVSLNHPHEPFHCLQKHWDLYDGVEIPIPQYPANLDDLHSSFDRSLSRWHGCEAVDVRDPEGLRTMFRSYYASVSYCDEKLGQVLAELEHCGLAEETIVIFASDHGDMLGRRGMVQKRAFYEASARISLLFHFPRSHPLHRPGFVCGDPVSIVDICPTLAELAGCTEMLPMDGRSLLPQLQAQSDPHRYVFSENHVEGTDTPCFMVRKDRWKYVYIHPGEAQLFDLQADPEEWVNLVGRPEHAATEEELRGLILGRFDPVAIDKAIDESLAKRWLLKAAHAKGPAVRWSYQPFVDAEKQYWRQG